MQSNDGILSEIAETVYQVCCFGGSNHEEPKKLIILIKQVLEAASKPYELWKLAANPPPGLREEQLQQLKMAVEKLNETPLFEIFVENRDQFFREENGRTYANPTAVFLVLKQMCEMNNACQDGEKRKKIPFLPLLKEAQLYTLEHFKPHVAFLTFHWETKVTLADEYMKGRDSMLVGTYYLQNKKMEPTQADHRQLLIESIVHDVKYSGFYFGMGNCQIMAEVAFLLAIQKITHAPLRYIQFVDTKKGTEELNALVVGNWPNQGCTVLAPWCSKKPFQWKGSFKKTSALKAYTECKVLFSVLTEKERVIRSKQLDELGFNLEVLLSSPRRAQNIASITQASENIFNTVQPHEVADVELGM